MLYNQPTEGVRLLLTIRDAKQGDKVGGASPELTHRHYGLAHPVVLIGKITAVLVLCLLFAMPTKTLLGRANVFEDNRPYLFLSARSRPTDANLEQLAYENSHIGYFRQDSIFGRAVERQLPPSLRASELVLLRASDYRWATADMGQIQQRLNLIRQPIQDRTFLPFLLLGGVAFCIGIFFSKMVDRLLPVVFGLLVLVSVYKYSHACLVCPIVQFLGIDAALLGAGAYVTLLTVWLWNPRVAAIAAPTACGAITIWQFANLLGATNLCVPCMLIMFGNCAVLPLAFFKNSGESRVGTGWSLRRSISVVGAVLGTSGLVFAHGLLVRPPATRGLVAIKRPGQVHLVGMTLEQLGVKGRYVRAPGVVMFGMSTCDPCCQARLTLIQQIVVPVQIFELLRPEQRVGTWGAPTVAYSEDLFPSTPTLVIVNATGKVVDQFYGWSSDPTWQVAFFHSAKQDLDSMKDSRSK
jgi:hypothetical protein